MMSERVTDHRGNRGRSPRIAIIDIGSNSVRLVVYHGLSRTPGILFNEKVMAGLGRGANNGRMLAADSMERAVTALARFTLLCDAMEVDSLRAVATAAVRDAPNRQEFVDLVRARTGLEIEVIDGQTEAKCAALGVIAGIPEADGVVGDLGGGSLELVRVAGGQVHERISLPLGTLRMDALRKQGRLELRQHLESEIERVEWAAAGRGKPFYAVGGSWRALAHLHMHLHQWPLPVIHQHVLPISAPDRLVRTLARVAPKSLKKVPSLSSSRVPQLPAAALLLRTVTQQLGSESIVMSAFGLREGLLFQSLPPEAQTEDPLISAAQQEARRSGRFLDGTDTEMGERLLAFTDRLFPDEPPSVRRLRHAACLLSDAAWRAHPDMRAEHGLDLALHGNWIGIDAVGRAMLANALWVVNGGEQGAPGSLLLWRLASPEQLEQARRWGLALRLGQRIGGGSAAPLGHVGIKREDNALLLTIERDWSGLYGEAVQRRHRALAQVLGFDPQISLVESPQDRAAAS